jgi:hypothetical protein
MITLALADHYSRTRIAAFEQARSPRPVSEAFLTSKKEWEESKAHAFVMRGQWNGKVVGYLVCRPVTNAKGLVRVVVNCLRADTPSGARLLMEFAGTFPAFKSVTGWYLTVGDDEGKEYLNLLKGAGFSAIRVLPGRFPEADGILFNYQRWSRETPGADQPAEAPGPAEGRGGDPAPPAGHEVP